MSLGLTYGTAGKNNGTLTQETIATWNPNGAAGIAVTQTFGYDAYDRIDSAGERSSWTQMYLYDPFGNRQVRAARKRAKRVERPPRTGANLCALPELIRRS